jgi:hypothetical protein
MIFCKVISVDDKYVIVQTEMNYNTVKYNRVTGKAISGDDWRYTRPDLQD